jgi:hypothetical protein
MLSGYASKVASCAGVASGMDGEGLPDLQGTWVWGQSMGVRGLGWRSPLICQHHGKPDSMGTGVLGLPLLPAQDTTSTLWVSVSSSVQRRIRQMVSRACDCEVLVLAAPLPGIPGPRFCILLFLPLC